MNTFTFHPYLLSIALTGTLSQVEAAIANTQPEQLTNEQIVRAWREPQYRQSLSAAQKKLLPENPAGQIICSADIGSTNNAGLDQATFVTCPTNCYVLTWKPCCR